MDTSTRHAVTDARVRIRRLRSQLLTGPRPGSVREVAAGVGALQAQDTRAARLAVRCRSCDLVAADVDRACGAERAVVRTWLMRGTLHMVAAEDAGWMVALLGPGCAAAGRARRLQLGLDERTCALALPVIRDRLAALGPLTRQELVREVRSRGIAVEPVGQAGAHLVAYAGMRGLVCRGPEREGDEPTYVLLEDWVGRPPDLDAESSLAELARRYVRGHGPATVDDFARWSGLGLQAARRGMGRAARGLAEVRIGGQAALVEPGEEPPDVIGRPPVVRLLGAFDAYLLGYRSRDLALPRRFARHVQAGGGWIHPAVVVQGEVVGTWRQERSGGRLAVRVRPFEALGEDVLAGLKAEAEDVGRFLGAEAALALDRGVDAKSELPT